jgi:hypothetical protein
MIPLMRCRAVAIALCAATVLTACAARDKDSAPVGDTVPVPGDSVPTSHEHKAPHGGALVELGEEYAHIELVPDSVTGTLTVYALDKEAETGVRVKAGELQLDLTIPVRGEGGGQPLALTLKAVASALTGETVAESSQFAATSSALRGVGSFTGVLREITVLGKTFRDVALAYPLSVR